MPSIPGKVLGCGALITSSSFSAAFFGAHALRILSKSSANGVSGLQSGGLASLHLAVCPSAACSPPCGAKVPHAFALWLSVLRRPVHQGAVASQHSFTSCRHCHTRSPPPIAARCRAASAQYKSFTRAVRLPAAWTVSLWSGVCASGRISAIQAKGAWACQGQTSVSKASSACSHGLFLLAPA